MTIKQINKSTRKLSLNSKFTSQYVYTYEKRWIRSIKNDNENICKRRRGWLKKKKEVNECHLMILRWLFYLSMMGEIGLDENLFQGRLFSNSWVEWEDMLNK